MCGQALKAPPLVSRSFSNGTWPFGVFKSPYLVINLTLWLIMGPISNAPLRTKCGPVLISFIYENVMKFNSILYSQYVNSMLL